MKKCYSNFTGKTMLICSVFLSLLINNGNAQISATSPINQVMSWVPPYSLAETHASATANFGACSPKDVITRVGLQFWLVNNNGSIQYDYNYTGINDAEVNWWKSWGTTNNIKILLCVNNADETGWNWPRAQGGFKNNRTAFVNALVAEVQRLNLDGVDIDLEGDDGTGDRAAFALFVQELGTRLKAIGKILTVDTFAGPWNGPNYNWWVDWAGYVDNINVMGYEDKYEAAPPGWQKYSWQQNQSIISNAGPRGALMGMPAWSTGSGGAYWGTSSGRGNTNISHIQELRYDMPNGPMGITIWDMQLIGWQNSDVWCALKGLRDSSLVPFNYYKFSQNTKDSSLFARHATNTGITYATDAGRQGSYVGVLNGSAYADIATGTGASSKLPTKSMTVSAWVKPTTLPTWAGFVGLIQDNGSTENGWSLGATNGYYSFALRSAGNAALTYLSSPTAVTTGQWSHLVGTYDGTTMKLYVNGVLKASSTAQSGNIAYPSSGWLTLGRYKDEDEDNAMTGSMDEAAIWGRTFTSDEVLSLYNSTKTATPYTPPSGTIVYYPLANNFNDYSGNNRHATIGGGTPNYGQRGTSTFANFNNNVYGDILTGTAAVPVQPTIAMTAMAWVRVDSAQSWGGFIDCVQDNGSVEDGWLLGTLSNKFTFALRSNTKTALTYLTDNSSFTLGQWYHVAATYDGTTMKLYVNGALKVSSTAQKGNIFYTSSYWFTLGRYKDNDEDWRHKGGLDEVYLINRALPQSEIQSVMNNTSASRTATGDESKPAIEQNKGPKFSIYPNPVTDVLNVNLDNISDYTDYRIMDISGHTLKTGFLKTGTNKIGLSRLVSGTYIIQLVGKDKTSQQLFIKNK